MLAWHGRIGRRTAVVERRWISGSCAKIVCWQLVTHMTHSNTHVERDPIQYALETDWPVRIRDRADRAYHYVRCKEWQQIVRRSSSRWGTICLLRKARQH
jgi:hypothetical protein